MAKWQRSFFQPVLPLGEDGRRVTGSKEHIALSRMAAGEGMVLLKNEKNTLPIRKGTKVALFGKGTVDYVKGGGKNVIINRERSAPRPFREGYLGKGPRYRRRHIPRISDPRIRCCNRQKKIHRKI